MVNCEKYKPTYVLIALNIAIYIAGAIVGGNALETGDNVVIIWGQVNGLVLQYGWVLAAYHVDVYSCLDFPFSG